MIKPLLEMQWLLKTFWLFWYCDNQSRNVNIISLIFYYSLFTQAYYRGLVYPEYVWFTVGGFTAEWWTEVTETNYSCPHWLVAKALYGSFGILPSGYIVDEDDIFDTLSGEVHM